MSVLKSVFKSRPASKPVDLAAKRNVSGGSRSFRSVIKTVVQGVQAAFGYKSATTAMTGGSPATPGSGESHMKWTRERLVAHARQLSRDNLLYSGPIDRQVGYIIGNGFQLQAKTADKKWNALAESLWADFWRRPDVVGVFSGRAIEQLVCKELLTCGDVGILLTDELRLQIFESEQIKGRTFGSDGIERDQRTGKVTGYWVTMYGQDGQPVLAQARKVNVEHFLFISKPDRPSSIRAVPPGQASFPMLDRINDMCDSEAAAAQLLARVVLSVTRAGGSAAAYATSEDDPSKAGIDTAQLTTRITELDHSLIYNGEPGDEIKGIDRNIPGKDFTASVTMFLRLLGMSIGLPLEVMLLDWTKSNYSQSRAVLEQAAVTFRGWQLLIEEGFHQRVYRWFVDQSIANNVLPTIDDRYAHEWIKPNVPWIDQKKEAEAKGGMIDRGFTSLSQVTKSLGQDREELLVTLEREADDAAAIAKRLEEKHGRPFAWEPFAGKASSVNAAKDQAEQEAGEKPPPGDDDEEVDEDEEAEAKAKLPVRIVKQVLARDDKGRIDKWVETPEYQNGEGE